MEKSIAESSGTTNWGFLPTQRFPGLTSDSTAARQTRTLPYYSGSVAASHINRGRQNIMEENDKPENEEKEKEEKLEDLTPEKDPVGGGLKPNAQKRE